MYLPSSAGPDRSEFTKENVIKAGKVRARKVGILCCVILYYCRISAL